MHAIVFETYGDPDVLHLRKVALPEPGPGEVRVAVFAAGTNPVDTSSRRGLQAHVYQPRKSPDDYWDQQDWFPQQKRPRAPPQGPVLEGQPYGGGGHQDRRKAPRQ